MFRQTRFMLVELVGGANDGKRMIGSLEVRRWNVPRITDLTEIGAPDDVPDYIEMPNDVYERGDIFHILTIETRHFEQEEVRRRLLDSGEGATYFYLTPPAL